jgi:hypothetical protein
MAIDVNSSARSGGATYRRNRVCAAKHYRCASTSSPQNFYKDLAPTEHVLFNRYPTYNPGQKAFGPGL